MRFRYSSTCTCVPFGIDDDMLRGRDEIRQVDCKERVISAALVLHLRRKLADDLGQLRAGRLREVGERAQDCAGASFRRRAPGSPGEDGSRLRRSRTSCGGGRSALEACASASRSTLFVNVSAATSTSGTKRSSGATFKRRKSSRLEIEMRPEIVRPGRLRLPATLCAPGRNRWERVRASRGNPVIACAYAGLSRSCESGRENIEARVEETREDRHLGGHALLGLPAEIVLPEIDDRKFGLFAVRETVEDTCRLSDCACRARSSATA